MVAQEHFEILLRNGAQWLRMGVEAIGALVVGIGAVLALGLYLRAVLSGKQANFNAIRLVLASYLALALEFQLGSDILSTAVTPTNSGRAWAAIAQLAAIAVIRTGLNYFLSKEIKEEKAAEEAAKKQVLPHVAESDTAAPAGQTH